MGNLDRRRVCGGFEVYTYTGEKTHSITVTDKKHQQEKRQWRGGYNIASSLGLNLCMPSVTINKTLKKQCHQFNLGPPCALVRPPSLFRGISETL